MIDASPESFASYPRITATIVVLFAIGIAPFVYEIGVKRRWPDPFEPIFWIAPSFFLVYGGEAAIRVARDDFAFAHRSAFTFDTHPSAVVFEVLLWAGVGLVMMIAGYYLSRSRIRRTPITFGDRWPLGRALVAIAICMIVGLAGYWVLEPQIGTGPRTELAKGSNKLPFTAVNLLNVANVLVVSNFFIYLKRLRSRTYRPLQRASRWRIPQWPLAVAPLPLVPLNIYLLLTLGGRERAFISLIVFVFLFHYIVRSIPFVIGMAFYAVVRVLPEWTAEIAQLVVKRRFDEVPAVLSNPYFFTQTEMNELNNVVLVFGGMFDVLELQYGSTFASPFFVFSPWNPFTESDVVFTSAFMPEFTDQFGFPMTLLGEFYVNFWYPGIVIGFLLTGLVIGALYTVLVAESPTLGSVVLFSTIANTFLLFGNFSNSVTGLGLRVLPMVIILYFVCGVSEKARATPLSSRNY